MSAELLETAEYLLARPGGPSPADACRAASTVYYAMFHCLSKSCCDLFIGAQTKKPPQRAWQHLYRSLSHAVIDSRCRNLTKMRTKGFPLELCEFASFLKSMQWKRERLDYAFSESPNTSYIMNDIALAKDHMNKLQSAQEFHKRAFAAYMLFGEDRHEKKIISV